MFTNLNNMFNNFTSLSCRQQTRATHCFTPIVLYRTLGNYCMETVVCHLLTTLDGQWRNFSKFRV